MLQGVRRGGRLTQIGDDRERQYREYITHGYLPLLVTNRLARKKIVRVLERKGFW